MSTEFKKIKTQIEKEFTNVKSKQSLLNKLIKNLKETGLSEQLKKELNDYNWELQNEYLEELNKRPFDIDTKLETLRTIWNNFQETPKQKGAKLIIGLYLWIPALRGDYYNSSIVNNKIHVILVKNKKIPTMDIPIPFELKEYISNFDTLKSNSINYFCNKVNRAAKLIFGKTYGINTFRHSWADFANRTMTVAQAKKIAEQMNHTYGTQQQIYTQRVKQTADVSTQT